MNAAQRIQPRASSDPASTTEPARPRICIVDDEAAILRLLFRILSPHFQVTSFDDGLDALSAIEGGQSFELIISDVMMPKLTGPELRERLLQRDPRWSDRFLLMTGGSPDRGLKRAGFAALRVAISKPFDPDNVLSIVRSALAKASAEPRDP